MSYDKSWSEKTPDELLKDVEAVLENYRKNCNYNFHFANANIFLREIEMLQTFNDVKEFFVKRGFSRGKITEDTTHYAIEIALDGPVCLSTLLTLNDQRMSGFLFKIRTLSWWECRFQKWSFKAIHPKRED